MIAAELHNDANQLLYHTGKRAVSACCGVKYKLQRKQILLGCDLIIGTAQRLLAFVREGKIAVQFVKIVVIDRVEDIDEEALKSFMEYCPKDERQMCLFTSGMTTECQQCIGNYLHSDFLYVSLDKLGSRTAFALSGKHLVIDVSSASKNEFMISIFNDIGKLYVANSDRKVKVIVFLDSIAATNEIRPIVMSQLPSAQLVSVDDEQTNTERQSEIEQFKQGQSVVLMMCETSNCEGFFFTVDHLIFHDIPSKSEVYFQLVCTVGENGTVTTLYDRHVDLFKSLTILTALKNAKQKPPYWLCDDSLRAVVKSDL
ncbi:DEAD domain containing protein [Trichuris trichiura]|uniref:RNA helicase n=1 Tax=Trichuris trichiura TaxID=36087 RepID=A0A077ZGM1_TRITR|nr:DEAD domain containing protein [Trichuris trichiura]